MKGKSSKVKRLFAALLAACVGTTALPMSGMAVMAEELGDAVNGIAAANRTLTKGQNEYDYLDKNAYSDFGLALEDPADFNDSDENPLQDYEESVLSELYVGSMNRSSKFRGSFAVADDVDSLSENNLRLDTMTQSRVGKTTDYPFGNDKDRCEYQTVNACGVDWDGDGVDSILQVTLYTGKQDSPFSGDKTSLQRVSLYTMDAQKDGQTEADWKQNTGWTEKTHITNQLSNSKDTFVWDIEADCAEGLRSMTAGDFDGDGREEAAIYVPHKSKPYIQILDMDSGSIKVVDTIYLNEMSSFGDNYDHWTLPSVNLTTTSIAGRDDLVINASLPLNSDYDNRDQNARLAIYRWNGKSMEVAYGSQKLTYNGYRMRFCSAADADLNGDGVDELLIAGYRNYDTSNNDKRIGKIDSNQNLIQMITWNESSKKYEMVWNEPKSVAALGGGLKVDQAGRSVMEPVALAAGKFFSSTNAEGVFLEGVVFNYTGAVAPDNGKTEKDLYQKGQFIQVSQMTLGGSHSAFISRAVAATFSSGNRNTEQLVVLSGDHNGSDNDQIYFDVSWMWEEIPGMLSHRMTDNDYISNKEEDDDGTFMVLCDLDVDKDAVTYQYVDKAYGWSKPEVMAVMPSTPYWEELSYNSETFGRGKTSFELTTEHTDGTEGEWEVGIGFYMGTEVMVGAGLLSNKVEAGFSVEMENAAKYVGSYYTAKSTAFKKEFAVAGGEDAVLILAVPVVRYNYKMWVPTTTITQEWLDQYAQMYPGKTPPYTLNQVVEGHWSDYHADMQYNPVYNTLSLEKYNELAEEYKDEGLEPINMDAVMPHRPGDPTTYPSSIEEIPGVPNKKDNNLVMHPDTMTVDVGEATAALGMEFTSESELKNGFDLELAAKLGYVEEAEVELGASGSERFEAGVSLELGGGASWVGSDMSGQAMTGEFAKLPAGSKSYQYNVGMGVWNTQISGVDPATDVAKMGPYVIGYFVTGAEKDTVPPLAPENLRLQSATTNALTLAWDNSEYRPADVYEIQLADNMGEYHPIGYVSGDQKYYIAHNLDSDTSYTFRMIAYRGSLSDTDHLSDASVPTRPLTAKTNPEDKVPVITKQPANQYIEVGGTATFAVEAQLSGADMSHLSYQWQKYKADETTNTGSWENISGATGSTYSVGPVDEAEAEELNHTHYRVLVSQKQLSGPQTYSIYSNSVLLCIGEVAPTVNLELSGDMIVFGEENYVDARDEQKTVTVKSTVEEAQGFSMPTGHVRFVVIKDGEGWANQEVELRNGTAETEFTFSTSDTGNYQVVAIYSGEEAAEVAEAEVYAASYSEVEKLNVNTYDPAETYYRINYELNGGVNNPSNPKVVTPESGIRTLYDPTKEEEIFGGWYLDEAFTQQVTEIDPSLYSSDVTLYAKWTPIAYSISYELNGGTNAAENPTAYTHSSPEIVLQDAVRDGYTFKGWYSDAELTKQVTKIESGSTGDVTLYAKWEVIEYNIYYNLNGGTNAAGNPSTYTVEDSVSLQNPSKDGATFLGWYADEAFETPITEIPKGSTGNVYLYAHWLDGNGTKDAPYEIPDYTTLAKVSELVRTKPSQYASAHYKVTDNIDAAGQTFIPIGIKNTSFKGTFDGQNYTISHLDSMLFGTTMTATIMNVTLLDGTVTGNKQYADNTGSIIGDMLERSTLVHSTSNAVLTETVGATGGLVGMGSGWIQNCYFNGSIDGSLARYYAVGGLLGAVKSDRENVYLEHCYVNSADIQGTDNVGALVGWYISSSQVTACYYDSERYNGDPFGNSSQDYGKATTEQFTSGEIAYLLNTAGTSSNSKIWTQSGNAPAFANNNETYKVTFSTDGAEYAVAYVNKNSTVNLPEDPTPPSGKHFMKWTANGEDFTETTVVTGDTTVEAVYSDAPLPKLVGHSLTLDGTIGVNFYYTIDDAYLTEDYDVKVVFDVMGNTVEIPLDTSKTGEVNGETAYRFQYGVYATRMTEDIEAEFVLTKGDETVTTIVNDYRVKDYFDTAQQTSDEQLKALMDAMSTYGHYAQLYFNVNPQYLPDAVLDLSTVTADSLADYAASMTTFEGAALHHYGSTLYLDSATALRFYLTETEGLENVCMAYRVKGSEGAYQYAELGYSELNQRYYGEIPSIAAHHLDDLYEVYFCTKDTHEQLSDVKTYGAMSYAYAALTRETPNEALNQTAQALKLYSNEAKNYFIK